MNCKGKSIMCGCLPPTSEVLFDIITFMILKEDLEKIVRGDVKNSNDVLEEYSRDTSLFKVRPEVVVFPKDRADVEAVVRYVREHKSSERNLSITGRSAGSDMTGGPLNESIILSFTKYMNAHDVREDELYADVEPGLYYRNFEKEILPEHLTMPTYPASKNLAALGGMIMNNCGGERTLRYGQMREFVESVDMTLSDGNTYTFSELTKEELEAKKSQQDFEGDIYRRMHALVRDNWATIEDTKPHVSKNSSGYALWRVWDRTKDTFNLAQLFVGSQGTLGILNKARVRLLKEKQHRKVVALFFDSWDDLPRVVNALLPFEPETLETFDEETLKLGLRFMPEIAHKSGQSFWSFLWKFLPEALIGARMMEIPDLVVLVELAEESADDVERKTAQVIEKLQELDVIYRVLEDKEDEDKYWTMRRESFNLLRHHVHGKQTAPFVEDFCVRPEVLPEFLPKAVSLIESYGIEVNIAGHAGNGNYHIIPLMDLTKESERAKIPEVAEKFYDLVVEYGGTITAEHNDGIIRTPFVKKMYGEDMYSLFEEVKNIFDPENIFNPGKKVGGSVDYIKKHIAPK